MTDSWNSAVLNDVIRSGNMGGSGSVLPDISPSDYGSYLAVDEQGKWGLDIPKTGYEIKGTETATNINYLGDVVYVREFETGSGNLPGPIAIMDEIPGINIIDAVFYSNDGNTLFITHPSLWVSNNKINILGIVSSAFVSSKLVLYYTKMIIRGGENNEF